MSAIKRNFFITLGSVILIEGIIVGIFFFLLQGFILPLAEDFLEVQSDIASTGRRVQDFKALVAPGLQRNVADIETLRSSFFVYSSDKSLEFIELLEGVAKRNNLMPEIGEFPSGTAPTQIRVVGRFSDIVKFLREFENGTTLFQISGLALVVSGTDMVSATVQFNLAHL